LSEYTVPDYGCVRNIKVYGLDESIARSKYPKSVDPFKENGNVTNTVLSLAQSQKGEGHDNYLCGIVAQFDLVFSVKEWVEAERYHFFDIISSQSTMHKISEFDLDLSYDKHVDPRVVEIMKELVARYKETGDPEDYLNVLMTNPNGCMLVAGITTNYRQLKTMLSQREAHRLPRWREFCKAVRTFPMAGEFIVKKKG